MASISSNKAYVRSIMTIMLKVREKTVRTIGLNKFSYIEIMIFAVNIFFADCKIKLNTL